ETAERPLGLSRLADIATTWTRRDPTGSTREFIAYLSALADTGLAVNESREVPSIGAVQVLAVPDTKGRQWSRVYLLGLEKAGDSDRRAIATAITSADHSAVVSRIDPDPSRPVSGSGPYEDIFAVVGGLEEIHEEE